MQTATEKQYKKNLKSLENKMLLKIFNNRFLEGSARNIVCFTVLARFPSLQLLIVNYKNKKSLVLMIKNVTLKYVVHYVLIRHACTLHSGAAFTNSGNSVFFSLLQQVAQFFISFPGHHLVCCELDEFDREEKKKRKKRKIQP